MWTPTRSRRGCRLGGSVNGRTVRADTPAALTSTARSRAATPPVYCAVTNAKTSAASTSAGGLPTTAKNTFRSYATAATVSYATAPPGTPDTRPAPAHRTGQQDHRKQTRDRCK
jgi:hypothetical protein